MLLWLFIIVIFVAMYQLLVGQSNVKSTPFSKLLTEVRAKRVTKVQIHGQTYEGTFKSGEKFRSVGPVASEKINALFLKHGVEVRYKRKEQSSFWQQIIVTWLPILLLVVLVIFFMRQLQSGGGKAMSFGKSRAKLLSDHHNKVTFADVAGVDEAKEELEEVVQFLKEPKKFTRLGGRIPKGVLLMGSPGTGKTLLARAVAGEAGVPFFSISGSDFVEMFVGVGASRVRDLFEQGKRNAPCIIFIDEIDAVGRHRGAGLGGGHDEREQTLNQLLVEMDGFESNEGVILIAATNRPDVLDPALQRPGRFDRRVIVPLPDVGGREKILDVHTQRIPKGDDLKLGVIARGTPGFSGADLENLVNEAALSAARDDKDRVYMEHFELAKDKVMMGRERRSMMLSEDERRRTAVHEAGHAIVGKLLPHTDPVHKVTIIPRGRALGVTMTLPIEDRKDVFREYLENMIAFIMGGRAADELIYNQKTAGASDDINKATGLARRMVCEWGMSEKLGPLAFGEKQEQIFLGREMSRHQRDYSEATAIDIDEEIRRIVSEGYEKAKQLLADNIDVLNAMAEALVEREVLSSEDLDLLLDKKPLPPFLGGKDKASSPKPTLETSTQTETSSEDEEEPLLALKSKSDKDDETTSEEVSAPKSDEERTENDSEDNASKES
ncbi:MAG: cell division protein FtsH [Deltaproteobacteria bacterium]|mgnify:CR=1 FL=1|nr:cell division protein FtsH [Deltaproteobacteria bacterium]MBU48312.1 cell division protein FtsH [Deltaproteobacteria bacterium]|tara:strand:+ start:7018 stop:9015 length:1998 start_codon:yes stop_codon:yes gene_type:complete